MQRGLVGSEMCIRDRSKRRPSLLRSTSVLKQIKSTECSRNRHQATASMVSSFEIPMELLNTEQPRTSIPCPFSKTTKTLPQKCASESQTIFILEFSPDIGVCSVIPNKEEVLSSIEQFKKIVQKVSNHPQSRAHNKNKSTFRKPEIKTITLIEEEFCESRSSKNVPNPHSHKFSDSLACQSLEKPTDSVKLPVMLESQRPKQKCKIHIDTPTFGGETNGFRFQS
eukprot:TRINITY_DN8487_c0_g1_i1.p1 TRINITY_DN8487_c0_g1~~TRINITY_DN8487_c0_g1_i1.p1  ORF type:complete len:225 (-),score=25.87 TRINITY_DN8487_c0_g1_i1:21-695(-)